MSQITYSCTALLGTQKEGVIKPDADGYYLTVLGALNIENSNGDYYPYDVAKELFAADSSLMRRITDGACRAEYGHPKKQPGMSNRDFMRRILTIEETQVCAHIKEVTLDFDNYTDEHGNKIIMILGKVLPQGPYGEYLKKSYENPGENVCFSIRSITNDVVIAGRNHKRLKIIVTWDYVNEPGIKVAKKWMSPSMESMDDSVLVTKASLESLVDEEENSGISVESGGGVSAKTVMQELKMPTDGLMKRPASLNW